MQIPSDFISPPDGNFCAVSNETCPTILGPDRKKVLGDLIKPCTYLLKIIFLTLSSCFRGTDRLKTILDQIF
jgi:hypothetical protein